MQISRHWRLNNLRYRLQGIRYENGDVSIQERPQVVSAQSELNDAILDEQANSRAKVLSAA